MKPEKVTVIPAEAVMALSKTHALFQSDKITLSEEAAKLIASTVEFRIKQIIQMAQRFMIKSIRSVEKPILLPIDIRDALRTLRMKDIDGYSNCYDYRYVWATKLYKGNRVIKRESSLRNSLDEKCWGRYKLSEIVQQDMQRAIPAAPGLSVHWMVVNGGVPTLSNGLCECITEEFAKGTQKKLLEMRINKINFLDVAEASQDLDIISTLAKSLKSRESDLNDTFKENPIELAILDAINKQIVCEKGVQSSQKFTLPKVEHLLTKEHRFFLKEIRKTVRRASHSMEEEAHNQLRKVLGILKTSPALDQLLPALSFFFVSEMAKYKSNQCSGDISIIIQYAEALTANEKIKIHHHVHQLLGPLLEVLLGPEESNISSIYRGLRLRKYAAQAIGNISNNLRSQNGLESIDGYLMSIYKREIIGEHCSLPILYGALSGIANMPIMAKRIVFYPLVPLLLSAVIKKQLYAHSMYSKANSKQKRIEEFKIILCQEIVHLIMGVIYDSGFEDVLSTVEDTGTFLSISREAKTMVNDTLMGCVDNSINPECFLPLYIAMISKCYALVTGNTKIIMREKRPHCEIDKYKVCTEDADEQASKPLPEIENIRNYMRCYKKANEMDFEDYAPYEKAGKIQKRKIARGGREGGRCIHGWYIEQATHAMTFLI